MKPAEVSVSAGGAPLLAAALAAAVSFRSTYLRKELPGSDCARARLALPSTPVSRLLKSWAIPPARTPRLFSFSVLMTCR